METAITGIRWIGRTVLFPVRVLGNLGLFLATAIFWVFVPPLKVKRLIRQIDFIGAKSITIVALTGAFTGMVLTLESYYALERFGADALLGPAVALSMIRELGPVISAFMITARAGSALTAEIGIMRITEQIDALEMMGLNPFRYLIVPNILAGIISFPLLAALFNVVGIYGGYLVGVKLLHVSSGTFFGEMPQYIDMTEILHGVYKSLTFGLVVAWICCYFGYNTGHGAEGVSKATTRAVVVSCVLILVCDYVITSLLF